MAQMTEEEWKRVLPQLYNTKPARQTAAYNHLVMGMTLAKAGEPFGYSRQDVLTIVVRVRKKLERLREMPAPALVPRGWTRVEFVVPRRQVDEVRRVVAAICPQPEPPAVKAKRPSRAFSVVDEASGMTGVVKKRARAVRR